MTCWNFRKFCFELKENAEQIDIRAMGEMKASVDAAFAKLVADAQAQATQAAIAAGLLINDFKTLAKNKTEDAKVEAAKVMSDLETHVEIEVIKQGGVFAKLQGCLKVSPINTLISY